MCISFKKNIGLTNEHIMKYMNYTAYYVYIYFLLTVEISKKNAVFCWGSPFWLVRTTTVDVYVLSFFFIHQVCRRIPIPPCSTKPYCPFWVKRTPTPSSRWFHRWEGRKRSKHFFKGQQKKTFPETNGKDFMLHSFKGIVLTLSCFK